LNGSPEKRVDGSDTVLLFVHEIQSQGLLDKLEVPISMSFANETPLEDVLKYIENATQGPNDSGIPIYVDPVGLQEAEKSMASTVSLDLEGVPLRLSLRLMLRQLGLTFYVRDGLLTITAEMSRDTPNADDRLALRDGIVNEYSYPDPKTLHVLKTLEQTLPMSFPGGSFFEDVISYIKKATQSEVLPGGLQFYVDPAGLQKAEKTMTSPVQVDLKAAPLKKSLQSVLDQLGLTYTVEEGLIIITSKSTKE
jgi:hypothetical protein